MSTTELTSKQRLLRSMKGEDIDRIAWSPFLAYYWDYLPQETQNRGQLAYLKEMGADPLLRGFFTLYQPEYVNCEIRTKECGSKRIVSYETPVGTLNLGYTFAESANSWFLTEHPVKEEEDFKVLQYIFEKMNLKEDYSRLKNLQSEMGEDGLILPVLGAFDKTPFQELLERWCGTVDLTYALYDFPEVVEECLAAMEVQAVRAAEISAASEAEAFIFWEDSSTTNISPEFFSKYTAPMIQKWAEILHKNDKLLIHHACGHIRDLLPLMNKTSVDMIESISPPPTGNIDLDEAFKLLGQDKGLIGGIEPIFFENCTIPELEARVDYLCNISKGRKYILANSDSCPPNVSYEKFLAVSRMIENYKR